MILFVMAIVCDQSMPPITTNSNERCRCKWSSIELGLRDVSWHLGLWHHPWFPHNPLSPYGELTRLNVTGPDIEISQDTIQHRTVASPSWRCKSIGYECPKLYELLTLLHSLNHTWYGLTWQFPTRITNSWGSPIVGGKWQIPHLRNLICFGWMLLVLELVVAGGGHLHHGRVYGRYPGFCIHDRWFSFGLAMPCSRFEKESAINMPKEAT